MNILSAILLEEADDALIDNMIDTGQADISDISERDLEILASEDSNDPSIEPNDVDKLAGIEHDYDIPDDAEVPDLDDLPSATELRLMDREKGIDTLYGSEYDDEDDVINDIDDVNIAVYGDADPDTEEIEIPQWAKELENPSLSKFEIEPIVTDDNLLEAKSFDEFLDLSWNKSKYN